MLSQNQRKSLLLIILSALLCTALLISLCWRSSRPSRGDDQSTVLEGHRYPVQALAFNRAGTTLTTAAHYPRLVRGEIEVAVWDVGTQTPLMNRSTTCGDLRTLSLAPTGQVLAFTGTDQTVWLWDFIAAPAPRQLCQHDCVVTALAFSRSGEQLAMADQSGKVLLWDWATGLSRACPTKQDEPLLTMALAPDGTLLASGGAGTFFGLLDTATGKRHDLLRGPGSTVLTMASSPQGRTLASGSLDGVVRLWDIASLRVQARLRASEDKDFPDYVSALTFAPDGETLAVGVGPIVQLWEVPTGTLMAILEGHVGKVQCLAYSPDGARLASGSHDRTVRLWDMARLRPMRPLISHQQ